MFSLKDHLFDRLRSKFESKYYKIGRSGRSFQCNPMQWFAATSFKSILISGREEMLNNSNGTLCNIEKSESLHKCCQELQKYPNLRECGQSEC